MRKAIAAGLALLVTAGSCFAQQVASDDFSYQDGGLVTASDVLTCPYSLVQPITVNVTEDYGADSRAKIFGKFRVEAKKLSADAVVLVAKGGKHLTAWAWSRREYTGRAIRYVDRRYAPAR